MASVDRVNLGKKLAESLQNDLRTLSNEAKKKHQPVKEAAEAGIVKIRNLVAKNDDMISALQQDSPEILQPFILGCDTKNTKVVQICVAGIQRLIAHGALSPSSADKVVSCLWTLMEIGVEEVKLLQTVLLLLNNGDRVRGDALAKALGLCLRLHVAKDSTTVNAASATIRQLVSLVFERVTDEDQLEIKEHIDDFNVEEVKVGSSVPPRSLQPCASDAYMLFQDLIQLINADRPFWLHGLTDVSRSLGLELLEELLTTFGSVFSKHMELSFLLKERVCPMIIKLFSPNVKHRGTCVSGTMLGATSSTSSSLSSNASASSSPSLSDRPCFSISVRLLRIVSVLIHKYHVLLVTECEIFLSLVVKFLDPDKPSWQRALALGVLHRMMVSPHLVVSFCRAYDSKPHSTKILRDIVNALGTYVQTSFISTSSSGQSLSGMNQAQIQGTPPSLLGGLPVGPGISPQPAFVYHGVWIPISVVLPAGTTKSVYLDFLDKNDVGNVPDSYGISIAFACLVDIVRSVALAIEGPSQAGDETDASAPVPSSYGSLVDVSNTSFEAPSTELREQLVESTWYGLLAAFCLLLEARFVDYNTDESVSESVLKAMQSYAHLTGSLNMTVARDAFVTALCKASLPPYYTLTVLSETSAPDESVASMAAAASMASAQHTAILNSSVSAASGGNNLSQYLTSESEYRPQVVAVGTPLLTSSLQSGGNQGSVVLTTKNLQCMRSILILAHCHGSILGSAWHLVLTTLQHLVWILGLKPSTGGSLKAGKASEGPNTVLTTAVLADLPILSAMLSRLFESSQYLNDVALHHLVDALCRLSQESMELAYSNREPSLFAVAKMLETGLVNLLRLEVLWRPLTNHLLEVCHHPHVKMREWGVEAVTTLVKEALARRMKSPVGASESAKVTEETLKANSMLRYLVLAPLRELSNVPHPDVRQKQLDCVLQVLHNNGDSLADGWPVLLEVIGALSESHGENLVRTAFQCLQLVVTDFLPTVPPLCLSPCINTVAHFGSQSQELNVSLSAVGLLWTVADHLHQNRDRICHNLELEEGKKVQASAGLNDAGGQPSIKSPCSTPDSASPQLPLFEQLWMSLYSWLAELCVDPRPAVRKSAGQTLFSTVNAHGSILCRETWQAVVWKVLFPLLDRVRALSFSASSDKMDLGGNILIHHSRNTAQKQWAETQVLVLSGVARVFATRRELLQTLGDFARAWALLLEFIEAGALGRNDEVSLAALKSFQEVLLAVKTDGGESVECAEETTMWTTAWKVWYKIGSECARIPESSGSALVPSQAFLTALVQIFPLLYRLVRPRFVASDLQKLSAVLLDVIMVPIPGESSSAFVLVTAADGTLTPLQEATLHAMDVLCRTALSSEGGNLRLAVPQLITLLLSFSECSCRIPKPLSTASFSSDGLSSNKAKCNHAGDGKTIPIAWVGATYVPFAEKALEMVVELYIKTADWKVVVDSAVFRDIIRNLRLPLSLKYSCPSVSTWKLAIQSLLTVLSVGLPVARKHEREFSSSWLELSSALEEFLFSKSIPPTTRTLEESQADEAVDCKVVQVIRDEILVHSSSMPKEFILKVISLLDRGSIHSTGSLSIEPESHERLREEFARLCFETLLQYSFLHAGSSHPMSGSLEDGEVTGRLAVTALLYRFKEVVSKYVQDERLGGKCPLPRHRIAEMSFVLKAASTLTVALKKAPAKTVSSEVWKQLIDLYPHLVDCTTSASSQVTQALKEALSEYHDLMKPPTAYVANGV